jgi:hypothetical protein
MRPLLACTTTLTVGTTNVNSTAIYVYVFNHTTDKLVRYSTTTSVTGLISFSLDGQTYAEDQDYEMWATLATATNIDERLNITIDTVVYTCLALEFKRVYNNDDSLQSGTQTLKSA